MFFNKQIVKRVSFWSILGLFLEVMSIIGGATFSIISFLFSVIFMGAIAFTGETVMRVWGGTNPKNQLEMACVVGVVTLSIPMTIMTLFIPMSSFFSFIISFIAISMLLAWKKKELPAIKFQFSDLLIFFILIMIVVVASKIPAGSVSAMLDGHGLQAWSDNYLHAITINSFSNNLSIGRGDPNLVDWPRPFYHYASFVLSSATIPITNLSGLATTTAILLPFGLLVAILGLYALAIELGGMLVAAISVALIVCFPEPSTFTKSGLFDFYWLLFTAPGSGYAIGVAAVACVLLNRYFLTENRTTICLCMMLLFSLIIIRAHMFIALAPAFFYILILHYIPNHKKTIFLCSFLLAICGFFLLKQYTSVNNFWLYYSKPVEFMSLVLPGSLYYEKLSNLMINFPLSIRLVIQLFLVLIAVLGLFVIIFPVSFFIYKYLMKDNKKENLITLLPWLLIINYAGLVLFAPTAWNGDLTEYKHRPFVLLYPLIVIFSTNLGVKIFTYFKPYIRKHYHIEFYLLLTTFFVAAAWTSNHNLAQPMFAQIPWAKSFFNQKITSGVLEISEFIKSHAKPGDTLAFNVDASKGDLLGPAIETISLTGLPAYALRTDQPMSSLTRKYIVSKRLEILVSIANQNNWPQAKEILQENGIRWYIQFENRYPNFDSQGKYAAIRAKDVSVYDSHA